VDEAENYAEREEERVEEVSEHGHLSVEASASVE